MNVQNKTILSTVFNLICENKEFNNIYNLNKDERLMWVIKKNNQKILKNMALYNDSKGVIVTSIRYHETYKEEIYDYLIKMIMTDEFIDDDTRLDSYEEFEYRKEFIYYLRNENMYIRIADLIDLGQDGTYGVRDYIICNAN